MEGIITEDMEDTEVILVLDTARVMVLLELHIQDIMEES